MASIAKVVKNSISLKLSRCEVAGRSVGYLSGGEGPTLLFIHGWAVTPYVYKVALDLAARSGNRVIAPFLPGFGPSEAFSGSWPSSSQISQWIEAFFDELGEPRPTVVAGHSLGGGISASYVSDFPGQVERLYLLSSVGGNSTPAENLTETRSALEWSLSLPLDLLSSQASYNHVISMVGTGLIQLVRDPVGLWRLSRLARNYSLHEELSQMARSNTRVVVVGAVSDKVITKDSIMHLARSASVDPVWVSGTHSWISTHPERFIEVITNFH